MMNNATKTTETTPTILLEYACPFCHSDIGEPCLSLVDKPIRTGKPYCAQRMALASKRLAPLRRTVRL